MADVSEGIARLTERQKEILRLIARHHQAKEISRLLGISVPTIKDHALEARKRLGVTSSRAAALILSDYEAEKVTILGGGSASRLVATEPDLLLNSRHEQTSGPEQSLYADQLARTGNGFAHAGCAGETTDDRVNTFNAPNAEQSVRAAKSYFRFGSGDILVDGRRGWFSQRLKAFNTLQCVGLLLIGAVLLPVLMAGILSAVLSVMDAIHRFFP